MGSLTRNDDDIENDNDNVDVDDDFDVDDDHDEAPRPETECPVALFSRLCVFFCGVWALSSWAKFLGR